jgi:hypothetical protein
MIISHRGNLIGQNPAHENNPIHIDRILKLLDLISDKMAFALLIELDVYKDGFNWYLGHDGPTYKVDFSYLKHPRFILHAKNIEAFNELFLHGLHTFFHDSDALTMTNRGFIWAHVNTDLNNWHGDVLGKTIAVMPEVKMTNNLHTLNKCAGICTDYAGKYLELKLD